jgi:uroporphyrinogen decarboxylase
MNDRLLRALRREPVDRTPVWFMRQAGRSLPRYRQIRGERSMAEILRDPPSAAEVTALPLEYYPVDAAVLFADLSTPFEAAGLHVSMVEGVGPVVADPIESPSDVDRLRPFDAREALGHILEQIRILVKRLDVPVIGFVGAPLTLCSYLIRGPRSRNLEETKAFLWSEPTASARLFDFWAEQLAGFALAQHEAGAAAIQLFDSWAGALSPDLYASRVLPHSRALLDRLREAGVPTIHFSTGNPRLLPLVAAAGGDAIGVDWRVPIDEAWAAAGADRAIQGNLDPAALLAGEEVARARARDVLERVAGRPGHIFNLGHGMLPGTYPAVARAVVEEVHAFELATEA